MPIISVRDNENNRWKKNTHTHKKKKQTNKVKIERGTKATVKEWELNNFVVR